MESMDRMRRNYPIYDELELPSLLIQPLFVAIICFEMVWAGTSHHVPRSQLSVEGHGPLQGHGEVNFRWNLYIMEPQDAAGGQTGLFPEIGSFVYFPIADTPNLMDLTKLDTSQVIPFLDPDGAT